MCVNEIPENSDVSGEFDSSISTIYLTFTASSCARLIYKLDSQSKTRMEEALSFLSKSVALSIIFGKSGSFPFKHK